MSNPNDRTDASRASARNLSEGRQGPTPGARIAQIAALLLAGLGAAACDCSYGTAEYGQSGILCDDESFFALARFFELGHAGKPGAAADRTAGAFAAKASGVVTEPNTVTFIAPVDVPAPNVASLGVPCELIAPFRVECTVGLCDSALSPSEQAVFGMSVVERSGAQREFSIDCSRVAGITATAGFGTPVPTAFAGATRVDLAFEHDGTNLIASAREFGKAGAWVEVSRMPLAAAGPFLPKLGAHDFEPGQMISYYAFRIPANAPYAPGQATPQLAAMRNLTDALFGLGAGAAELARETPDISAATQRFQGVSQLVADAVAALDAAAIAKKDPNAKRLKKARKAALKATKSVTKTISSLDPSGAGDVEKVFQRTGVTALSLAQAVDAILPDDLRVAAGGLTLKSFLRK